MVDTPKDQGELTEEEIEQRRDEALKRALNTPPKPHKAKSKKNRIKRGKTQSEAEDETGQH